MLLFWLEVFLQISGCVDVCVLQFPQMIRQEIFRILNAFQAKKELQRNSIKFPKNKPRLTGNFGRTLRRSYLHSMLTLQTRASGTCNEPPENNSKVIYRRFCGVATTRDLSASYFSTIQHLTFETCTLQLLSLGIFEIPKWGQIPYSADIEYIRLYK